MRAKDAHRRMQASDFPVRVNIPARFSDLDTLRHINNVAVADIFAEGRNAFIRALFHQIDRPEDLWFMVAQVGISYLGEAHYPATFEIANGVLNIGRSSFRIGQAFFHEGRCTSVAETLLVATRRHLPLEIPQSVRESLEKFVLREADFPRILI